MKGEQSVWRMALIGGRGVCVYVSRRREGNLEWEEGGGGGDDFFLADHAPKVIVTGHVTVGDLWQENRSRRTERPPAQPLRNNEGTRNEGCRERREGHLPR
jgi:hypothetical protein